MVYDMLGDEDEMAFVSAAIVRELFQGKTFTAEGLGIFRKEGGIIRFVPDVRLEKLMDVAEKYPSRVVPYNEETKRLWAIDTIGDGGLHLMDDVTDCFYLGMEDGQLTVLDESSVSDEYDDDKDYVAPDAVPFDAESARRFELVCQSDPWSVRDMRFLNRADIGTVAAALGIDRESAERGLQDLLTAADEQLQREASAYSEDVLFIQNVTCLADVKNKLIRLDVDCSTVFEW